MNYHDQHIHSNYSKDSNEPLESYYKKAVEYNCKYVITCEHFEINAGIDNTKWEADFQKLLEEQKILKEKYPAITPLLGIEIGYHTKEYQKLYKKINEFSFDLVQLSLHDGEDDYSYYMYLEKPRETLFNYFNVIKNALETFKEYDVLSHLDYGYKNAHKVDNTIKLSEYNEILISILKILIVDQKSLEVNTKLLETINDDSHMRYLLKLYKSLGGSRVTLSSDAHNKERYMSSFAKAKELIKECGFNSLVYYIKRKEYLYNI